MTEAVSEPAPASDEPTPQQLIEQSASDSVWRWFLRGIVCLVAGVFLFAMLAERHRPPSHGARHHACSVSTVPVDASLKPCTKRTG